MTRASLILLIGTASWLTTPQAAAQEAPTVAPEDRVRVTAAAGERVIGRFQEVRQGRLRLMPEDSATALAIPLDEIMTIERSTGVDRGAGFAMGAMIGTGAALVGGLLLSTLPTDGGGANMAMAGAMLVGVPIGVAAGGYIGASRAPERWHHASLPRER